MELRHEFTVPASVEETWTAFNDIESVAGCFPGASVTSVEGDTFQGSVQGQARADRARLQRLGHLHREGRVRPPTW